MTRRPAVRKLFDTAPIGRCTRCGVATYDMRDLNARCSCGRGIVASVAMPDWRRCPACQRTGKSLIAAATPDGSCPVCCGVGWITAAEYPAAESELIVQQAAVDNALDAATGQRVARSRYFIRSRLGSVARLATARSYDLLRRLRQTLFAYQEALDRRMSAVAESPDAVVEAAAAGPSRLRFLSDDDLKLTGRGRSTKSAAKKAGR